MYNVYLYPYPGASAATFLLGWGKGKARGWGKGKARGWDKGKARLLIHMMLWVRG